MRTIGQLKQKAAKGFLSHRAKQPSTLFENSPVWRHYYFGKTISNFPYFLVVKWVTGGFYIFFNRLNSSFGELFGTKICILIP